MASAMAVKVLRKALASHLSMRRMLWPTGSCHSVDPATEASLEEAAAQLAVGLTMSNDGFAGALQLLRRPVTN